MKRILSLTLIMGIMLSTHAVAAPKTVSATQTADEVILRLLSHSIFDAIDEHYENSRQFMNDKVVSIRKVPDTPYYEVVVQVETFEGPHNPPYGLETMTFYISYGTVELRKFEHVDA